MDPSGPATDLDLPMEVIIGTVPLRNFFGYMSAEAAASAVQPYPPVVGPADYYEPTAPPMAQPNLPSAPLMPGAPPDARMYLTIILISLIYILCMPNKEQKSKYHKTCVAMQ